MLVWLQWRHNGLDGVSNHQPHDCLLNRLFRRKSKKASKLRVTVLCAGNSPVTGEFPAQRASNAESVSIWWCHHVFWCLCHFICNHHDAMKLCICISSRQKCKSHFGYPTVGISSYSMPTFLSHNSNPWSVVQAAVILTLIWKNYPITEFYFNPRQPSLSGNG